jgi:hypothetical protein
MSGKEDRLKNIKSQEEKAQIKIFEIINQTIYSRKVGQ